MEDYMNMRKKGKAKILSFLLSLSLLIGLMPTTAMAQNTEVSHTTVLVDAPLFCESNLASLPKIDNISKELLVFTVDNAASSQYNCSEIAYSIYNGKNFTVPVEIERDNTWDMDPFIYSNNDVLVAWTDATKSFDQTPTGDEISSAMRISLAAFDNTTSKFKITISNVSSYGSDNLSTYYPKVTKFDEKILVSWVVCHNVSDDNNAYGIEGLYYNPETDTFYSENNEVDASGNPVPMIFAKNCNYISSYAIADEGNQVVTIFEEAIDQTHISDVMFDKVVTQSYNADSGKFKDNVLKMATQNGTNVTTLTDGASYASIVDADISGLYYYNNDKIYALTDPFEDKLTPKAVGDVSKTGDTKYSIVSKNGMPMYITAMQYQPLKTSSNEIHINGIQYKKTDNEKWIDEDGNIQEIKQEDICLYFVNQETQNLDILSQKLYNEDGRIFPSYPSFIINESNQLACTYTMRLIDSSVYQLMYSKCDEQYLLQADYTKVNEAIVKANSIEREYYKDFSAVETAINAVVRGKDITEQEVVNAMAKAIEDAIAAQLKPADYSKVDEFIKKANALNKDNYKDFSPVTNAINAVVRGKDITEQTTVDGYATAIDNVIKALELKPVTPPSTVPKIVEGANQRIEQGESATFKSNADLKDFKKVLVDGKEISSDNYTLTEGSTIVTFKSDYIKTLSIGKHAINIVFTTGSADTEFVVTKSTTPNTNIPQTGDSSNMIIWISLLFVSVGGVLTLSLKRRKSVK